MKLRDPANVSRDLRVTHQHQSEAPRPASETHAKHSGKQVKADHEYMYICLPDHRPVAVTEHLQSYVMVVSWGLHC